MHERPTTELDLTDPLVRAMAEENHVPVEHWTLNGVLMFVHCHKCYHPWPCPTRRELEMMKRDERSAVPLDFDG